MPTFFRCRRLPRHLPAGVLIVRAAFGRPGTGGRLSSLLLGSLLIARADQYLYLDTHAWRAMSADNDEVSYRDWYAAESLFFNEPDRINDAIDNPGSRAARCEPMCITSASPATGRNGCFVVKRSSPRTYSPNAWAAALRSLELINDDDDRISFPIGSMSGLHHALHRLGERMNRDEDVLVLLLTSHGSREDGIAVNNGDLPLNNMAPDDVRRALDASGIEWRVIIVSACYAGTFIDPLKTDRTLVITAADAEHTSFGCADDRDLTYFGEAFLRDALPKAELPGPGIRGRPQGDPGARTAKKS